VARTLEAQVAESVAALAQADERHAAALAEAETARRLADQQHAAELALAATRLAESQQHADERVAAATAVAATLEAKVADSVAALAQADERHAAALAEAEAARLLANQQHAAELALAATRLAESQQHAEERLAAAAGQFTESAKQAEARLAQILAAAEADRQRVELQHAAEVAALRDADARRAVEERAAREEADAERIRLTTELARQAASCDALTQQVAAAALAIRRADEAYVTEKAAAAARLAESQKQAAAQLAHAGETLHAAEQRAAALQRLHEEALATAQKTLERAATERAALAAHDVERDAQLRELAARLQASEAAAAGALAEVETRLRLARDTGVRDRGTIQQLQQQFTVLTDQLDATRSERDVLKTEADRVPRLRTEIDEIRAAQYRQFDRNPASLCRFAHDGTVIQVNQALARLLGYQRPDELQHVDFAANVFESADELPWIIERCLSSKAPASVDTSWRRKDGTCIIVSLVAVATADSIDIAAQDITAVCALEEKLRNSQRMEAVARFGSEIAATCDKVLHDVAHDGRQWLAMIDSNAVRRQGELLLDEVTRAAGLLQQLAVYGAEQKNAAALVDVKEVLRDLEPVLKRVAGDNIEFVMPKASTPHNLDVEAERVERILVNVAAHGRARMPNGGQLMFEVGSVVVDRTFVTKHPNVRPGDHVLLTVTEAKGAARARWPRALRKRSSSANVPAAATDPPGLDLGGLQALVSDCGGHLWMMAEPRGDMVLKIHLPRRALDRHDPPAPPKRSGPGRWLSRLPSVRH